jgi:hypothetical protein
VAGWGREGPLPARLCSLGYMHELDLDTECPEGSARFVRAAGRERPMTGGLWTPGGDRPARPSEPGAPRRGTPGGEVSPEPEPERGGGEPTEAELEAELAAMQAELAETPAAVIVANHAVGLFQLAAIHLNQRPPNLPEGRLAIDAMGALVDGVGERLGDQGPALQEALNQLRMAFVQLSEAGDEGDAPTE